MRTDTQEAGCLSSVEQLATLERTWCEANAEVIRAQRAYDTVLGDDDAGITSHDCAWLRLWHAQERERDVAAKLAQVAA